MAKGRKPISDVPKTETTLRIRLTNSERAELDAAADLAGLPTSTWLRDLGLAAARASQSPNQPTVPVEPMVPTEAKTPPKKSGRKR